MKKAGIIVIMGRTLILFFAGHVRYGTLYLDTANVFLQLDKNYLDFTHSCSQQSSLPVLDAFFALKKL